MTEYQFSQFYNDFQKLTMLLEQAEILKLGGKTEKSSFEVYKKMNEHTELKKKIISDFGAINKKWVEEYNEMESHPVKLRPFPEIYDLTELDENNFNYFYKEYEKLDNLFLQAYCDVKRYDNKVFESKDVDEDPEVDQISDDDEQKLRGMIGSYYSMDSVIEYNRQEEKITKELAKLNQKWLESKNQRQLTRYEGDTNIKTKTFRFPYIYTLFEKLIKIDKQIQEYQKDRNQQMIDRKEYEWNNIKKEIITME